MNKEKLLSVIDLSVLLQEKYILNNLNLTINTGEVHVIMGPNGVGKSTLAKILIGDFVRYNVSGSVFFRDINLFSLSYTDIALNGVFLSFQNPIEIPGVTNIQFIKSFINCKRKFLGMDPIEDDIFLLDVKKYCSYLNIDFEMLNRSVNVGFSGGEKKKNEVLQMFLLDPKFVIFDEIDSGLDVDSLKCVFNGLNTFKNDRNALLIITHYCKILDYINVDHVHIMYNGTIVKSGGCNLIYEVEKFGYNSKNYG